MQLYQRYVNENMFLYARFVDVTFAMAVSSAQDDFYQYHRAAEGPGHIHMSSGTILLNQRNNWSRLHS